MALGSDIECEKVIMSHFLSNVIYIFMSYVLSFYVMSYFITYLMFCHVLYHMTYKVFPYCSKRLCISYLVDRFLCCGKLLQVKENQDIVLWGDVYFKVSHTQVTRANLDSIKSITLMKSSGKVLTSWKQSNWIWTLRWKTSPGSRKGVLAKMTFLMRMFIFFLLMTVLNVCSRNRDN